jgi:hypothetical protein
VPSTYTTQFFSDASCEKKPPSRPRFFDLLKITGIGGYEQNKIPAQTVENHQTTLQKSDGWVSNLVLF